MAERAEFVAADDGCRLWTARSGPGAAVVAGADRAAALGAAAVAAPGAAGEVAAGADRAAALGAAVDRAALGAAADRAAAPRHGFVLCHGGPGFWDTLGPIARILEPFGPVVRWDQRGGGRSQWQGPYTVARFLADLDQVRAHHGFDSVTLLGHSWGATLALQYALASEYRSRVRGLVYVAGVGIGPKASWMPEFAANKKAAAAPYAARIAELEADQARTPEQERRLWQLRLAGEFPDQERAMELAATQVVEIFDEDERVYSSLHDEVHRYDAAVLAQRARALDVPVLIVDGLSDLRPRHAVDSLAVALPTVTRVRIADAGHFPWLDAPDVFEDALCGWLIDPARFRPSSRGASDR